MKVHDTESKCKLCFQNKKLCRSHIIPEFLHSALYNSNQQFMGISGLGNKGWKPLQQGEREHLLCRDCETLLNDRYEKPFRTHLMEVAEELSSVSQYGTVTLELPYAVVKLFHLRVLYLASVSTLPSFCGIQLGRHQDKVRSMLLQSKPGHQTEYPIIASVLLDKQANVEDRFVSAPIKARHESHTIYAQVFGGIVWYVSVSSHRNTGFERIAMKSSGEITLDATKFHELPQARLAATLLRKANK